MEVIQVCRMVARTLMSEIGPWGDGCALFGGLVPGLLVPEPRTDIEPHIGTRDVDFAIGIATLTEDKELYRSLKENLTKVGLKQSKEKSYVWSREIEGFTPVVELFVPIEDPALGGRIQKKPIENSGSGLTALGIYGLEYIDRDIEIIEDEGQLLDDIGIKKVRLRVCGPAMLIALKAWALDNRNKAKDGYDVVWILKALGPEAIAKRFVEKGLPETDCGKQALVYLEECFATPEHTGSKGWLSESGFEGEQAALEAREACGIVLKFVALVRDCNSSGITNSGRH